MKHDIKIFESDVLGEKYYLCRHSSGLSIYFLPKKNVMHLS